MSFRVCSIASLFLLAVPAHLVIAQDNRNIQGTREPRDGVTMNHTRAVLPGLAVLGWKDFFLNEADEITLSASQVQQLFLLRLEFADATSQLEERVKQAELELYDELDGDQVSARGIEAQARWISVLRGEFVVLHWRYLLRAINILDHEQQQKLVASLKLQGPMFPSPAALSQSFQSQRRSSSGGSHVNLPADQLPIILETNPVKDLAGPCRAQATISAKALVRYGQGREAAKSLINLSRRLRRMARGGSRIDKDSARQITAQMQAEVSRMEATNGEFELQLSLIPQARRATSEEGLRTSSLAQAVESVTQELNRDDARTATLDQYGKEIEQLTNEWRKAVKRASEKLCLVPPTPALQ